MILDLHLPVGKELWQSAGLTERYPQRINSGNYGGNTVQAWQLRKVRAIAQVTDLCLVQHGRAEIMSPGDANVHTTGVSDYRRSDSAIPAHKGIGGIRVLDQECSVYTISIGERVIDLGADSILIKDGLRGD